MKINSDKLQAFSPTARPTRKAAAAEPTETFSSRAVGDLKLIPPGAKAQSSGTVKVPCTVQQHTLGVQATQSLGAAVAARAASPGLFRDPQVAVKFVDNFDAQLGLSPEMLKERNDWMVTSPAKFLRVNPALFGQDVGGPSAPAINLLNRPAPTVPIGGDYHLGNVGTVRNAQGETVWGCNDGDMASKGSPEYDLGRLATSMILMAKDAKLTDDDSARLIKHMAKAYLDEIDKQADNGPCKNVGLDHHEAWGPVKNLIGKKSEVTQEAMLHKFCTAEDCRIPRDKSLLELTPAEKGGAKAFLTSSKDLDSDVAQPVQIFDLVKREGSDSVHTYALVQSTELRPVVVELKSKPGVADSYRVHDSGDDLIGKANFNSSYKLQKTGELAAIKEDETESLTGLLANYDKTQGATPGLKRPLKVLDMAAKLESGGSTYGLHRYYVLAEATQGAAPVILEVKQELPTAPESASGDLSTASAQHIYDGMSGMGLTVSPMMAPATMNGTAYLVREREREKGALDMNTLDLDDWKAVAEQAGMVLARNQSHQAGAAKAVSKWVGDDGDTLVTNLQNWAQKYARQTREDTRAFAAAHA